jgi:hypothetical protein
MTAYTTAAATGTWTSNSVDHSKFGARLSFGANLPMGMLLKYNYGWSIYIRHGSFLAPPATHTSWPIHPSGASRVRGVLITTHACSGVSP